MVEEHGTSVATASMQRSITNSELTRLAKLNGFAPHLRTHESDDRITFRSAARSVAQDIRAELDEMPHGNTALPNHKSLEEHKHSPLTAKHRNAFEWCGQHLLLLAIGLGLLVMLVSLCVQNSRRRLGSRAAMLYTRPRVSWKPGC